MAKPSGPLVVFYQTLAKHEEGEIMIADMCKYFSPHVPKVYIFAYFILITLKGKI